MLFKRLDLTISIDAQAALPGRIVGVGLWVVTDKSGTREEYEARAIGIGMKPVRAPTEPAARLAALLRAMAEGGE